MFKALAAALVAVVAWLMGYSAPAAAAAATSTIQLEATIDGFDLDRANGNRPIALSGRRPAQVAVEVTNRGIKPLFVRSIRIMGPVAGLTFFSYETRVDMIIAAGASDDRKYEVDLVDLADQATGLIPGRLVLLNQSRDEIASRTFATQVDGSLRSVYGIFGLMVAGMTATQLAGALWLLSRRRLSPNRWKRGARLGVAGVGLGLTATFSMSALSLLLPSASSSLTLILVLAIAMFVLGYFSPTPDYAKTPQPPSNATWSLSDQETPRLFPGSKSR